jgi:hypothetical protein
MDKPLHNPTARNRALLGHAKSKAGSFRLVPFDDVPQRIADGLEYIGIPDLGAQSVIMREPDVDESVNASVEPEAA